MVLFLLSQGTSDKLNFFNVKRECKVGKVGLSVFLNTGFSRPAAAT
jgi:hypothetical protein